MGLLSRRPFSIGSLFQNAQKQVSQSRGPAAKRLRRVELLEDRSVPAIIGGQVYPPSPAAAARSTVSGFVFCDDNGDGVRDAGEHGIAGVNVQIVRLGFRGGVVGTVQTDASGLYFFGNLPRASYGIVETQPADPAITQGGAHLGTINGAAAGRVRHANRIDVNLPAAVNAINYNFSEVCDDMEPPLGGTEEEPQPEPVEDDADCPVPAEAPMSFTQSGSVLNITGTSQGDVFRILSVGDQVTVSFTYLDGNNVIQNDTRTFDQSAITAVNIKGQYGDDTLIVDNGGAGRLLGVTVNFDGGLGDDTLRLRNGTAETQVYTAGQAEDTGSVTLTAAGGVRQTVNYSNIGLIADTVAAQSLMIVSNNFQQPISVLDGALWGADTTTRVTGIHRDKRVTICHHTGSQANPGVPITIARSALKAHAGHGDEILSDEPPTTPIEFANKGTVTVMGGNGGDFFLFDNPNTATGLTKLTLDGGNGRDAVDLQAEPVIVGVIVDVSKIEKRYGPFAP